MFNVKRGRPKKENSFLQVPKRVTGNLLTVREVSDRLKVHEQTVYLWVREGKIKPKRIGRMLRFTEEALGDLSY